MVRAKTADQVEENVDFRKQVIENALQELNYWKTRYGQYRELFQVVEAIDKTMEQMSSAARNSRKKNGG